MFRRKEEENATNFSTDTSAASSNGTAHSQESLAPLSVPPTAQPIPVQSAYAPSTMSAPRAAEPARPVTSAASTYRPSPIAEFNRTAASRPSSESSRAASSAPAPIASALSSALDKNIAAKPNRRVLTVGNDILLKGEIATCDRLVIEGRVEAKLSDVHTVEIAECGSFTGTAEVEDAEISGVFEGDLIVHSRLVIYTTGEVRGNISYGEIEVERGGKLTGQIKTSPTKTQASKTKSADATETKGRSAKETVAA